MKNKKNKYIYVSIILKAKIEKENLIKTISKN